MAKYLDINGLNRFLDKIKGLLNLKADKIDTYTKSEVDALVAEGGGGGGDDNGIIIPADTYTMEIDGKTYYALSGISAKKMALCIDYYDRYDNICNGFAFTTNSRDVTFNITSENYREREDVGEIYMHLNPDGKRYQIYDYSGDYDFTKSAERKFHTLYWDNEMIKFDLKKIVDCGTELAEKRNIFVSISSEEEEVKIINYGKYCVPLFAKPDGRPNRFEVYSYSEEEGLFLVTNCDATQVKLHFSSYLPYALPKHENVFVTNNSIKAAYYPNPVYFVTTRTSNSSFDFVGSFSDNIYEKILTFFQRAEFKTYLSQHGQPVNRIFNPDQRSIRISGNLDVGVGFNIKYEEPPVPLNKKDYIYNHGLIYIGRMTFAKYILSAKKFDACIYRYRKRNRRHGDTNVKFRKVDLSNSIEDKCSFWGNMHVRKISKTGVKSVITDVFRVRRNKDGGIGVNQ